MKNSSDTIGNPTRDLPACSAVPQPTAPPRALLSQQICSRKFNEIFGNRINVCHKAISIALSQAVFAGLSPGRRRFNPRPLPVGSLMDNSNEK